MIHHGLDALDIGLAPDQVKQSFPLAFVDLADLFMIGRAHLDLRGFIESRDGGEAASETCLLVGNETHAMSRWAGSLSARKLKA